MNIEFGDIALGGMIFATLIVVIGIWLLLYRVNIAIDRNAELTRKLYTKLNETAEEND